VHGGGAVGERLFARAQAQGGASYGDEMPVNSGMSPLRAFT